MTFGIIGNLGKSEVPSAVASLVAILKRRGLDYLIHERLAGAYHSIADLGEAVSTEEMKRRANVVIAFGGDGTMLSTGRMLAGSGISILGVNLGKLGFLAEFSIGGLDQMIDDLLADRCRTVTRSLLTASFPELPDAEPMLALNDIVMHKGEGTLMIELETYVNGDYLGTYRADGLILATPTGSTAYSLAVGGPVVVPSSQVTVIAPIAPHMLTARPVVVPDTSVIEVFPVSHRQGEEVHVYADGQLHRALAMPTKLVVTRYEQTVSLVKSASTTYFDILRAKLLWGREPVLSVRYSPSDSKF